MKKVILSTLLLLFLTNVLAQDKKTKELQNRFWKNNRKEAKVTEIPEKWKNESAVVLFKDEYFEYTNNGKKMYNPSYIHKRIKLQDKAAVEEFSEVSFAADSKIKLGFYNFFKKESKIGVKIIKPDGSEKIIDIKKEGVIQDQKFKLAIPHLEIGDILDMFIFNDDFQRSMYGLHIYDPVERLLNDKYPVVYSRFAVEVENDYFLNMESYNGAPKIKEEQTDRKATRRFVLEATDLEKKEIPRWFYPFLELPHFKMQVTFALKARSEYYANVFLSDDDKERKNKVTKDDILEYYGDRFRAKSKKNVKDVLNFLKEKGITNKREQLVQALYFIRHRSFNRFIESIIAHDNLIAYYPEPCGEYTIIKQNDFVNYFSGIAKALEIDYDVIVATPDYNGSIDNILIRENVVHGLRFNFDKPLYFFEISPHVQPELFSNYLEGTKAYVLSVVKNRKIETVNTDVLPITTAQQNVDTETIRISFDNSFKNLTVNREQKFSGHFKSDELNDRVFFNDYLEEEFKRYQTRHFYHCKKRQDKADKQRQEKMTAVLKTLKKKHIKSIEKSINNEFDAKVKNYQYEIVDAARYSSNPLIIKDSFTIENQFVKKAGKNFIVEVGKFIGGQIQIKPEERERTQNIYLSNARVFEYEVIFDIPEGYEVVGLDKLNKNVSNQTGSFISSAEINDGKLIYHTKKIYKQKFYDVSNWNDMLAWLDAAYDFSQQKVMFKKI